MEVAAETPLLMEEAADELEQAKAWKAVGTVKVTVDLAAAAHCLVRLLRRVDRQRQRLYQGPDVKEAIRRYKQCWLVLAKEMGAEELRKLKPPLDVEWVWLCHRLNPEAYAEDCAEAFGGLLDGCSLPLGADDDDTAVLASSSSGGSGSGNSSCSSSMSSDCTGSSTSSSSSSSSSISCLKTGLVAEELEAVRACQEVWRSRFPDEPFDIISSEAVLSAEAEAAAAAAALEAAAAAAAGSKSPAASPQVRSLPHSPAAAAAHSPAATARSPAVAAGPMTPGTAAATTPAAAGTSLAAAGSTGSNGMAATHAIIPDLLLDFDSVPQPAAVAAAVAEAPPMQRRETAAVSVSYDLETAVARQSSFFFQVDRPWMLERNYLKQSLQRYRMFLHLVRLHQGLFAVPTYDIDLLWHAHMMCAAAYAADTHDLLGRLLGHDDSDAPLPSEDDGTSRDSGKRLEWGFRATAQVWDKTYGVPYDRAGAMYRGPSPSALNDPPPKLPTSPLLLSALLANAAAARLSAAAPLARVNAGKGLKPRMVFQAQVMVWGAMRLTSSVSENFFVVLRSMAAAPDFSLRSRSLPYKPGWPEPSWKQRWALQCELSSKGLVFELRAESGSFWGSLWGPRMVGSAKVLWQQVLQESSLLWDKKVLLPDFMTALMGGEGEGAAKGKVGSDKPPALHLAISVTPPEPGPFLMRSIFMRGSDDTGAMVCEEMLVRNRCRPQMGRWASRTVLDHRDHEIFVIRKRVAKGTWHGTARPVPVHPRERVIVVHRGGWTYVETEPLGVSDMDPPHMRVGYAAGPLVAQAVPLVAEGEPDFVQAYCLLGCLEGEETATLTVRRSPGCLMFMQGLELTLTQDSRAPVRLLSGRHLQYQVKGATAAEEVGFVTLMRFPPWAPQGVATALLNWKGAVVEVAPTESVLLALLLCTAISEAINDMVGINRVRRFRRVTLPDFDYATHWGAMATPAGGPAAAKGEERGEDEFRFASVESAMGHWWNRRPPKWMAGAGSCGAGACGPSVTEGMIDYSYRPPA